MKLVVFVTGTTGSGKTTMVRQMGLRGWYTFHSGDLWRKTSKLDEGDSPITPQQFDDTLRESLVTFFEQVESQASGFKFVAIEAIPRAPRQVEWVDTAYRFGYFPLVIALDAKASVRMSRVQSRDMANPQRFKHDLQKFDAEADLTLISDIMEGCREHEIPCQYQDTTEMLATGGTVISDLPGLECMMSSAWSLFVERRIANNGGFDIGVKHMLERAREEINEAIEKIDKNDFEGAKEEVIDSVWFQLVTCLGLNMNARSLFNTFMQKVVVNGHREDTGTKPTTEL